MYNITEEQIKDIALGGGKSKIKQMFPQVFQTVPEKGNWYRVKYLSDKFLIYFNGNLGDEAGYGFGVLGHWADSLGLHLWNEVERATDKEVEKALIAEAKRRYGTDWQSVKIKEHADKGHFDWDVLGLNRESFITGVQSRKINGKNGVLFYDGKWAEIIDEPKKLEVGKWYKSKSGAIAYYQGDLIETYGFNNGWIKTKHWFDQNNITVGNSKPATDKEVEEALIAEAKRRYKVGDRLTKIHEEGSGGKRIFSDLEFRFEFNKLYFRDGEYMSCIFKDGIWSEVIEEPKKLEVGKWYKSESLIGCYTGRGLCYGFFENGWDTRWSMSEGSPAYKPATDKEVKEALAAEAKRRFKAGDRLTKIHEECSRGNRIFSDTEFGFEANKLYFRDGEYMSCIFKDGIWSEVIKSKTISRQEAEDRLRVLTGEPHIIN